MIVRSLALALLGCAALAACESSTDRAEPAATPTDPGAGPAGKGAPSATPATPATSAMHAAHAAPGAAQVTYDDHGMPVGLHHFNPYTDRIISGGQPEGDEAFRNLAALGVKTIVSVDGARPDLALAKKHGLRYVHVPMQYSAVTPAEQLQLAKAIETTDGSVYIHCHHGKHRSPAATGVACVSLGLMTPEQALAEMKVSGTDPKYQGLFRDVANAKPLSKEALAAVPADLPEIVAPDDLTAVMVDVDLRWEHLKASKDAKWGIPPKNPDVDPPHEARMLWEQYREISRLDDAKQHGDAFLAGLAEGEAAAKALEDALRANDAAAAQAAFDRAGKACSSCHKKFRDN